MAKVKPTIVPLSGKFGDVVHVDSNRYDRHVRKAVAPGSKKNEPALKQQYARTKYLNVLASEINSTIRGYYGNLKPSTFYQELQSRFRKEPLNNRFLLLLQLKGMEVNPAYPLSKLGNQVTEVSVVKNKIIVNLQAKAHPAAGKHKANCYCYEVLLLTWDKGKKPAAYNYQLSDWVYLSNGKPEIEFTFRRTTETVHWLLFLRQQLGVDENVIGVLAADGMQVVGAGSLDKKDLELLKKREGAPRGKHSKQNDKAVQEVGRVKVKRFV